MGTAIGDPLPSMSNPNLAVVGDAMVQRVLFEGTSVTVLLVATGCGCFHGSYDIDPADSPHCLTPVRSQSSPATAQAGLRDLPDTPDG